MHKDMCQAQSHGRSHAINMQGTGRPPLHQSKSWIGEVSDPREFDPVAKEEAHSKSNGQGRSTTNLTATPGQRVSLPWDQHSRCIEGLEGHKTRSPGLLPGRPACRLSHFTDFQPPINRWSLPHSKLVPSRCHWHHCTLSTLSFGEVPPFGWRYPFSSMFW